MRYKLLHPADVSCPSQGICFPLTPVQELIAPYSKDINTTELFLLRDNVVAPANVTGGTTPYCEDVNVVDSSLPSVSLTSDSKVRIKS